MTNNNMEKRAYCTPSIEVVSLSTSTFLLTGSDTTHSVGGNAFNGSIQGGSGGSRTRGRRDDWSKGWSD